MSLTEAEDHKYGKIGYRKLRGNAKEREIPFSIKSTETLIQWWQNTPDTCHWCKRTLTQYQHTINEIINGKNKNILLNKLRKILQTHNNKYLTYDRRNSDKGYELSNLVKSCLICNTAKGFIIDEVEFELISDKIITRIEDLL